MPMINFTNPFTLFLALILFILILVLARETKKSAIVATMLFIFLIILIGHTVEFFTQSAVEADTTSAILRSIVFDLIFIFLSFISYLWIDDKEAKEKKNKSIDNSLEWFWSKV